MYDAHSEPPSLDRPIASLDAAEARGVRVRAVYNDETTTKPGVPPPQGPSALQRLAAAVPSTAIPGVPDLMHHKYVVRDGTYLWTGSANWTEDAWTHMENVIVTASSADLAAAYTNDFEELWNGRKVEDSGTVVDEPASIDGVWVRAMFSPGRGRAHAKLVVCDDVVFTGSSNCSRTRASSTPKTCSRSATLRSPTGARPSATMCTVAMPITPDTKDWTWVIETRCPECGFDAAGTACTEVAGMLRAAIQDWFDVLTTRRDAAQRVRPDKWSALEYGCHVRDVFRVYERRVRRMLSEDGPHYENWDQDATALEDDYGSQDPAEVAHELVGHGAPLVALFESVDGNQWQRTGFRSDNAAFTVDTISRYFIHDIVHHLWDVR